MNYRSKIAMFGHMGIEADPARMSGDERMCFGDSRGAVQIMA